MIRVIRNSLMAIMACIAVFGIFSLTEINTLKIILLAIFGVSTVGSVVLSVFLDRPRKLPKGPHGETPEADYGDSAGAPLTDGLWLVSVDDETGRYEKIMNLTLPNEKDVTRENIKGLLKRVCDEIDVKLNELKN